MLNQFRKETETEGRYSPLQPIDNDDTELNAQPRPPTQIEARITEYTSLLLELTKNSKDTVLSSDKKYCDRIVFIGEVLKSLNEALQAERLLVPPIHVYESNNNRVERK